ncbi:glycosyltransferase family 2 protein [Benzoatithermus flavus]|uniref:Glycosyltransferase family 2 protein n=1 Tax=Benzoatithermus flavus TaxID=3108223 RepID=A0ABU8XT70_9PROT
MTASTFPEPEVPTFSIVVPAYNEDSVLEAFHARLAATLDRLGETAEVIYINDGSHDRTRPVLDRLQTRDPRVAVIDLSRNFGKEVALTAGLHHARGQAVIVIDADLQDPPELIPELVAPWRERGVDVVYAQRIARAGESWLKRATAHLFYRLMQHVGRVHLPPDTGDYRLLSRRAVEALNQYPEQHRFMKGLFTWIGFEQVAVRYERDPRFAGRTKWSYAKLVNLAIEGITSFTSAPLRFASILGLAIAGLAFVDALWIIYKTLRYGDPVAGYPSLMTTILFLGGVQLTAIGILGEYLGRVFDETKHRPLYHVKDYRPARLGRVREPMVRDDGPAAGE